MVDKIMEISDGNTVSYRKVKGDKNIGILMLHGMSSSKDSYKNMYVEGFCKDKGYDYVALDFFGHGKSSGSLKEMTISKCFEGAAKVIDEVLDDTPYIIMGSSMGGWLAFLLAEKYPNKFKSLIGIAPAVDFTDFVYSDIFSEKERKIVSEQGYITTPSNHPDVSYYWSKELFCDGKTREFLKRKLEYSGKITILAGDKDLQVPFDIAFKIKDSVASLDVTVIIVKDADHGFHRPSDLDHIKRQLEYHLSLT